MKIAFASLVVAALAGTALAGANPGDIVFTNQNNTSISLLSGGSVTTLVSLPGLPFGASGSQWRPSGITADNNGRYYFGNQPFDFANQTRPNNGIFAIDGLFGGAPTVSSFVDSQFPFDVDFDAGSDSLVYIQNPFRFFAGEPVNDGIYGSSLAAPSNQNFFTEDTSVARPFYEAGVFLVKDPNSSDYFVTANNGGVAAGVSDDSPSTLWRFSPNFTNPAASTMTLVKDFSSDAALTNPLRHIRGVTAVPGTNELYITNNVVQTNGALGAAPGVYRVTLNPDGSYASLTLINSDILQPEAIEYNPFTGQLIVSAFNDVNSNGTAEEGRIYSLNLDGSGLTVLAEGVHARDFHIVPTPGVAALAGLAGLAGLRRRRSA